MVRKFDFLVIGSGIAGMSFALKVAQKGSVALICKAGLEEANTFYAQGGIASVTNLKVDNFEKHIHDTMVAGDWISDPAAVEMVIRNAPSQIDELIRWGVNFDKKENGEFDEINIKGIIYSGRTTGSLTCTEREDTRSSAFSITRTIRGPKFRPA